MTAPSREERAANVVRFLFSVIATEQGRLLSGSKLSNSKAAQISAMEVVAFLIR
jgi:hypothetical protein